VAQLFSLGGLHTLLENTRYILAGDAQDVLETFGSFASGCCHIILDAEFFVSRFGLFFYTQMGRRFQLFGWRALSWRRDLDKHPRLEH
jgi:hypothetical protein